MPDQAPKKAKGAWKVRVDFSSLTEEALELNPADRWMLLALAYYARHRPFCYPSNDKLIGRTHLHGRSVQKSLDRLEAAGWIDRILTAVGKKQSRVGIMLFKRIDDRPVASTKDDLVDLLKKHLRKIGHPGARIWWSSGRTSPNLSKAVAYVMEAIQGMPPTSN